MENIFSIDSLKCINHDQPLHKLYNFKEFNISEFEEGYVVLITIHNIDELMSLQKETGYKLEISSIDKEKIRFLDRYTNDEITGTLTIIDDV